VVRGPPGSVEESASPPVSLVVGPIPLPLEQLPLLFPA